MKRSFVKSFAASFLLIAAAGGAKAQEKAFPVGRGYDTGVRDGKEQQKRFVPRVRQIGNRELKRNASALKRSATAPKARRASGGYVPTIYGTVLFDNTWTTATKARGVYSFRASADNFKLTAEVTDNDIFNVSSGYGKDDTYNIIGTKDGNNCYFQYNTENWTQTTSAEIWSRVYVGADLTWDAASQKVYGAFPNNSYGADHYEFGTIDFSRSYGLTDIIGSFDNIQVVAMAASPSGEIFAMAKGGDLYQVDKATGTCTRIGNTGVDASDYLQSATFDPKTGKLYWASTLSDETSALYEVNTATAHATEILKFPHDEELVALYIPMPAADDNAPAAVSNLTTSFAGGSLTGEVCFTMPSATFSGQELTDNVEYYIVENTDTITKAEAKAGSAVNATITLPKGGMVQLKVLAKNAAGFGPATKSSFWAGFDKPLMPASANLAIADGKATVTWEASTASVHGGALDGETTYDVVRFPGEAVVANGVRGTSFTDVLPKAQLANIYYGIVAKAGEETSDTVQTNAVAWGDAFEVPYEDDLTKEDNERINFYSVIDANNDESKWMNYYGHICYKYNMTNAADDWLLTPPIHLKGGQTYMLTFGNHAGYSGTERIAAAYGLNGADISSYKTIVEPREISGTDITTTQQRFTPEADGDYRFGFHALSDADQYYLYMDNVKVEEAASLEVPAKVTDLKAAAADKGALKATVAFTTPDKTASGNALAAISKVEISRGDELIATLSDAAPGRKMEYTDENPANGYNVYTVACFNEEGKSDTTKVTTWVGLDAPAAVKNIKLEDLGDNVKLAWDAPDMTAAGAHGGYVDPQTVSYSLYDPTKEMAIVGEHISATEFLDTKIHTQANESQGLLYYSIISEAKVGDNYVTGGATSSQYMRTGIPAALPFKESVPGGESEAAYCWSENNHTAAWGYTNDLAADNDKGALAFTSSTPGDWSIWHAPKLSLAGAKQPYLIFSYYVFAGDEVVYDVQALDNHYEPKTHKTINCKADKLATGWHRTAVSLADYTGSLYVIPGIKATVTDKNQFAVIDDVEVRDVLDNDLAVSIAAPGQASVGAESNVDVTVSNEGVNAASAYTVSLYKNGNLVETKNGETLNFTDKTTIRFSFTPGVTDETMKWKAVVNYAADNNAQNNTSDEVTTTVRQNDYPTAENLKAEWTDLGVKISWNAISDDGDNFVEESFEDYDAWTQTSIGEWATVDGDGGYTYNLGSSFPFKGAGYPMAWMVMNPMEWTLGTEDQNKLAPHSGNQYLISFDTYGNEDEGVNQDDDWLISPELSGKEQEISFFAKSLDPTYKETFNVYYSTGSDDTKDFIELKTVSGVPSNWTEYNIQLPEGAKKFAIVNRSKKKFALMLDDISYNAMSLKVDHYNIYSDGRLIGSAPAGQNWFIDQSKDEAIHQYQVSVVYESGESPLSEAVSLDTDGIHGISANALGKNMRIYTIDGKAVGKDCGKMSGGMYIINGKKVAK